MSIKFNWIGGACFIITIDDVKIAVDPCLCPKGTIQDYFWFKSERIEDPVYNHSDFEDIDLWLITHNHEDHIDKLGMSMIQTDIPVVCNPNSVKILKNNGVGNLKILKWFQKTEYKINSTIIEVEAIPAIHGESPVSALLAGKVNGYYLTITQKDEIKNIYITSDTVLKSKVINALEGKNIDLMIPNMGAAKEGTWIMTLTLNARMLKKMITVLNPKIVIPVHYGTFAHYVEPIEEILALNDDRIEIVKVGDKINLH